MADKTILFKSQERKKRSEISEFLRELAVKVDEGEILLRQGAEEIRVQLPSSLVLEVQVDDKDKGAKGIKHSLEIELEWYDSEDQGPLEIG